MTVLPTGHPADFNAPATDERTGGRLQSGGRMFAALLLDMESANRQPPSAAVAGSNVTAATHPRVATGPGTRQPQLAGAEGAALDATGTASLCQQSPGEPAVTATRTTGHSGAAVPTATVPIIKPGGAGRDGVNRVPTDAAIGIADLPAPSTPLLSGAARAVELSAIRSPADNRLASDFAAALLTAQAEVGVNVARPALATSPEAGLIVTLAVPRGKPEDLDGIVRRVTEELARTGHANYRLVINGMDMTPRISNGGSHGNR